MLIEKSQSDGIGKKYKTKMNLIRLLNFYNWSHDYDITVATKSYSIF